MIYYYFVCRRKLWLFHNDISMEDENELVQIGKFIDSNSYSSERKHIMINEEINIDFAENSGVIHEIKKSRKIEDASVWQLKYFQDHLKHQTYLLLYALSDLLLFDLLYQLHPLYQQYFYAQNHLSALTYHQLQ